MPDLLNIKDLKTWFHMHDHTVKAVNGVSLQLGYGETLGIVGESGCGKSVLALSVMRLVPSPAGKIESGSILLEGKDLLTFPEERMRTVRGNKIGMIFQEPMTSLNPLYTVGSQIAESLVLHKKMQAGEAAGRTVEMLELVGIPSPRERVKEYPFQLSGGMRQRVMIAMALACEPLVIIADEPTTALDVTIQSQILRLMRKFKETLNTSIMFITHDLAVIAGFADRVLVVYTGRVMETAPVKRLFAEPLHPYTKGLLASIPRPGYHKQDTGGSLQLLPVIKGNLPHPGDEPPGCCFAGRCSYVMEKCRLQEPPLYLPEEGRNVRCYLYE